MDRNKNQFRIKELRKKLGLTQVQLAAKVGLSQPQIVVAERGDDQITLRSLRKIALALEVELIDLFRESDDMDPVLKAAFHLLPDEERQRWLDLCRQAVVAHLEELK